MNIKTKEILNFIMEDILWWIEDENITSQGLRETLSDETMEELIEEVNNKYNTKIVYTEKIDKMNVLELSSYIYREVVLG